MKRPISSVSDTDQTILKTSEPPKKLKSTKPDPIDCFNYNYDSVLLDENLLYEVMKHVDDARTLASAACVSKQWCKTAQDERLWELICTKHSAGRHQEKQLRLVVTALGGFRQLFSLYLWPLLKPSSSSSTPVSTAWPSFPAAAIAPARSSGGKKRWGKDEVNLSLSLLSISYYGKMNFNKSKRK